MFLIFISLITGWIGLTVGMFFNAEGFLGFIGFLSPTLFLVQKMYLKLENLELENEYNDTSLTILDKIKTSFINQKIGREFKTQEIINMVRFKCTINESSIIPSDYCYNRMNMDKWENNQLLDFNIFEYVGRDSYIYLGEDYPYNGDINYKAKGSSEEIVVGKWTKGERVIYNDKLSDINND